MNNPFKIKAQLCTALFGLVMLFFAPVNLNAQSPITLKIGDPAPPLKYSKWIKGTPVSDFKEDQMYVLEFWATWCGPCIAAMPHLSDLSEKYAGKVTFIGADVWEKTGDKPYESSLPNVVRFVEGNAKNMRYNILADTKDQYISNNWLKPAGINGIPTTVIIQKGKIVWMGHPAKLEEVIDPLLAGTFDIAANQASQNAKKEATAKEQEKAGQAYKGLRAAMEAKDYNRILFEIDSLTTVSPDNKSRLVYAKFDALLRVRKNEALSAAKEIVAASPRAGANLAFTISQEDGLPKDLYQFGIDQLKDFSPTMSLAQNALASMYAKKGDFAPAAEAQQKALDLAKAEVNDPKFSGRVFDYTITDYQKKLKEYKNKIK